MSRKNRDEWNTSELRWRGIWAETQEITSRKTREGPFDWLISCFSVCGGQFTDDRLTDWSIDWKVLSSLKVYRSKNLLPASAGHYFPEGEKQPTHTSCVLSRDDEPKQRHQHAQIEIKPWMSQKFFYRLVNPLKSQKVFRRIFIDFIQRVM